MAFKECQAVIIGIEEVDTMYGKKPKAVLQSGDVDFDVFLNQFSIENMNKAFGNDTDAWKDKIVNLKKLTDKKYGKECIVLKPVA